MAVDSLQYGGAFFFMLDNTLSELLNLETLVILAIIARFHTVANESEFFELQCRENIEDSLCTKRVICKRLESLLCFYEITNAFDHRYHRAACCFGLDSECRADICSFCPRLLISGFE